MKHHFKNLKNKEFWKRDIKRISISDILILIAIFLMFMASWNNIQAGNDPCSYCVINNLPEGDMTCREYFSIREINLTGLEVHNESIKGYDFRETS